jgi:hypothetical protein
MREVTLFLAGQKIPHRRQGVRRALRMVWNGIRRHMSGYTPSR